MKNESRGPSLDMQKCTKNVGDNRFNLILIAACRARELKKSISALDENYMPPTVTALLEIQEGKIDPKKYLLKIK